MHVTGPVIWKRCSDCEGSFYTKPSIDWRRNPLPVFVYAHSGENPSNLLTLALSCIKLTKLLCTGRTSLPPTPPSFKSSHARILCVLWIWSGCRPTLCLYFRASLQTLFPGTKTTSWVRTAVLGFQRCSMVDFVASLYATVDTRFLLSKLFVIFLRLHEV